jgi:hypothetical protein
MGSANRRHFRDAEVRPRRDWAAIRHEKNHCGDGRERHQGSLILGVVSSCGADELPVQVYNRTSMQHSTLQTNGHMKPVERLRYMDRYLVSGGRDATVKIWSL